MENGNVINI